MQLKFVPKRVVALKPDEYKKQLIVIEKSRIAIKALQELEKVNDEAAMSPLVTKVQKEINHARKKFRGKEHPPSVIATYKQFKRGPTHTISHDLLEGISLTQLLRKVKTEALSVIHEERKLRKAKLTTSKVYTVGGHEVPVSVSIASPRGSRRASIIHEERGTFVKMKYHLLVNDVYKTKKVPTKKNHVGFELEFCAKVNATIIARMFVDNDLHHFCQLKGDGSLKNKRGDHSMELNILVEQDKSKEIVTAICKILNSETVGAYVNETCGFHLHIDMRNRDVKKAYKNLYGAQKFLREMHPASRQENRFCKKNSTGDMDQQLRQGERYWVINPQAFAKYQTLEMRVHSGTVNAEKILFWQELCIGIADAPAIERPLNNLSSLAKRINMRRELFEYIKARMEKFKKYHNDNENTDVSVIGGNDRDYRVVPRIETLEEAEKLPREAGTLINWNSDPGQMSA